MNFLSWIIIAFGLLSPILLFMFKEKHFLINILFMFTPLSTLALVISGVMINDYLMYDNSTFGYIFYILCISEVTLILLYLMYYACVKGIAFVSSENDWSKVGPKHELFILLFIMICLLLMPHFVFGMLYSLWGILSIADFDLSMADSIFLSFSLVHSIPLSKSLVVFQEHISTITVLRYVQILHVLVAKFIEFIVIGFIIGKVATLIQNKLIART